MNHDDTLLFLGPVNAVGLCNIEEKRHVSCVPSAPNQFPQPRLQSTQVQLQTCRRWPTALPSSMASSCSRVPSAGHLRAHRHPQHAVQTAPVHFSIIAATLEPVSDQRWSSPRALPSGSPSSLRTRWTTTRRGHSRCSSSRRRRNATARVDRAAGCLSAGA